MISEDSEQRRNKTIQTEEEVIHTMLKNYSSAMEEWQGRIDSTDDYGAFRWHQSVQALNLNENPKPFSGALGFAIIGFCCDLGVRRNKGRAGASLAPNLLRRKLCNMPCAFEQSVCIFDAGNISTDGIELEEAQSILAEAVTQILRLNLFPIVLGGGHETTFGHYLGQLRYLEDSMEQKKSGGLLNGDAAADLGIVNFDAHFDMRPYDGGASSGSMFLQIADICRKKKLPFGYMPLGIQRHSNTVSLFRTAEEKNVKYVLARALQYGSQAQVYEHIDNFMYQHENAYITVCTDVFSAAFAPGVSATQALGLDPEAVVPLMKHILRTRKVRGFDICEISPRFDHDDTTASLGAVLIFAVVTTLCSMNHLSIEIGEDFY